MLRYGQGDVAAFEALYRRHEMGTWRFILRSVRVQAVADDLLQDVWFSVARQADTYQPSAKFKTWLFTLAHHRVVDHFRSAKAHVSLDAEADDDSGPALTLAADSGFGPVRQLESRQQARALLDAIESLPAAQRQAFLLQAEAGMDVQEIARTTGTSFETAKSRLRYARSHLREVLKDMA
ncbi:MAG: sigma-70 family RNA polymerase sigma factor [Rhodoferax sp.]|nr:sigma-70 family RNA polymerase sigma factor [Rhodoferax sp.]